ncbi:MAG TPA: flavodoxin-dependent (E)-4-hydroxy-3-methylbut-2-enyl-diphosphate synthase [Bacteroidetes bacterium]|nr:flavodoxin-dependent (E)-4-hydroxy-3-methylbut-2-enyl-diphosphate synthase [Bacteroidota bacterium]
MPEKYFKIKRKETRIVRVGNVVIGGNAPISVQSMTATKTEDVAATVAQIKKLEEAGCEIIRLTVPDEKAAQALQEIKKQISIPIVADIHFDYRMALQAIESGADKIRINPGNIGVTDRIKAVLRAAKERSVPIRIGINSGSVEKDLLEKYSYPSAEAMVASALRQVEICQDFGFDDLVISIKSSHVPTMILSNRMLAEQVDFPLHLGVTEAGLKEKGSIKSAIGIGSLLWQGIGDTIRVSLTDDPVEEVKAGFEILKSLELRKFGLDIISCPTCGRIEVDLIGIVKKVEKKLGGVKKNVTVSILGCAVNGPGEAREADIGVACGKHSALIYKNGETVAKIRESEIVEYLVDEVNKWGN